MSCGTAAVAISTEDAVRLDLLANELVTDAIKYPPPRAPGDVMLTVTALPQGGLRLEVRDHGPSLPTHFDSLKSTSLGMKLISRLGRQLGGKPEWRNAEPGTRFMLEFTPQPK